MAPQYQLESEMLNFVLGMVHTMGHRVAELRALADSLLGNPEFKEKKTFSNTVQRVSEVAEELAQCIRNVRFLHSYDDPGPHDFLTEVMQPAFSGLLSIRSYRRGVRLVVDLSARGARG